MIPGLPGNVFCAERFFCWVGLKLGCGQEGSRPVQRLEQTAGKKAAAGNSAKQSSAKHKGDSPLEERWPFGSSPLGHQRLSGALRKGFRVIFIIAIHTLLLLSDELLTGIPPFSLLPV